MNEMIVNGILVALTAGISFVMKAAFNFLNAKISVLKSDECLTKSSLTKVGLETAQAAVKIVAEASVGKLEEIIAKDLRVKIKNGEASKEELYFLATEAYNEIISSVKPELLEKLSAGIENVELYIKNQIENQLLLLKAKLS